MSRPRASHHGAAPLKNQEPGYPHEYFIGASSTLPAHVFLPGVHMVASLLKRWLTGTLRYAASQDHLDYYLDEYTFRFNRRTLCYWRHLGTGPRSFRIGRGVRYWHHEVTTWLQTQSDGPTAA